MFEKLALMGAVSALAYTGYAVNPFAVQETAAVDGQVYHYLRSENGQPASHVYVYRAADNQVEVYQTTARCAEASYANAWVSPETGRASSVTLSRLMPAARHEIIASFQYDSGTRMLRADAAHDGGMVDGRIDIEGTNWHLKNLDLATLSVQTIGLADPRGGFSFELPAMQDTGDLLENSGRVTAEFASAEDYQGSGALRFTVSGTPLDGQQGSLWLDAETHHVIGAEWGAGESAYELRLVGTEDGQAGGWQALLTRHYEGCSIA